MNKCIYLIIFFILIFNKVYSQNDKFVNEIISDIYSVSLNDSKSYDWLEYLSKNIGPRLSGSLNAERSVKWTKKTLESIGLDSIWLQPVMVPKWVRGNFEYAFIESSPGNTINVNVCALGGSIPTPSSGIKSNVIEVKSFKELESLGKKNIKNKIVFFNRPMQKELINTFESYSNAVNQRYDGARIASKYGALAVIVRSLTLKHDYVPHTGVMSYGNIPIKSRIPAMAISTNDADLLSSLLNLNPNLKFFMKQNCRNFPDVLSYNVIGEIKGSKKPNDIILIGAHLDSWDLGDGSHDDGAGVVQSMDVLRILKKINYKFNRTLRVVLFMNEENGQKGAIEYFNISKKKKTNHLIAIESDAGGFTPRGFSINTNDLKFKKILSWKKYFEKYQVHYFVRGQSGVDIEYLKNENNVLVGLRPDSQRYFDYHHSSSDIFETVNQRELELGTAAIASLVFLSDFFQL
ncbi:MAG: peptidase M28 family protein [Flavobacteriaceae bacterium]|nr:peptidase M28 family protein [Flavobacteriaceae bacterium]